MQTPEALLPDSLTLTARLVAAFNASRPSLVTVLERKRPRYMSTFPNEIVTCRLPDGSNRRLFCKYEAGRNHSSYGHRGGLAYEAEVYYRILRPLGTVRPGLVAAHTDHSDGGTWLLLEYLDHCTRLKDIRVRRKGISQPVALSLAARWLGQFHTAAQPRLSSESLSFLKRYDAAYYAGWVRRTWELAKPLRPLFPWLAALCKQPHKMFAPLLDVNPTLIHGEFYINNILVRRKNVFPVDWESAAIAAAEIDLAALIEGPWRPEVVQRSVREYLRNRWPGGPPAEFPSILDAARLYLHFRWLGEREDWTLHEKNRWRFEQLRLVAQRQLLL
ncbi:MAG TPA: phosphotransferase [Candidatus Acidoferrum sp.]|jgi:hypothetical protein|nr:phosphotransferase [Candidatus Acidoferrum sp.]